LVAGLYLVLAVCVVSPSLLSGNVMSPNDLLAFQEPFAASRPADIARPSNPAVRDAVSFVVPDLFAAREQVRQGHLPLWNPNVGGGQPLLGVQQSAPLYPLHFLSYVLPFWSSLGLIAVLEVWLGAFGTFLFGRRLGMSDPPAFLAGVAFAFGTGYVTWLEHPESHIYCLLPWSLLLLDRVCREGGLRSAVGLGALGGAALLGGHPETQFAFAIICLSYAIFRLHASWGRPRRPGQIGRRMLLLAVSGALALCLSALATLPLAELLGNTTDTSRSTAADPLRVGLGFFFPEYRGRSDKTSFPDRTAFSGAHHLLGFPDQAFYFGALPLLLGIVGLLVHRRRDQLFFLLLGGGALLTMLDTPANALVRRLPLFSKTDLHWLVLAVLFSGAMLAGYGLQALLEPHSRRIRLRVLVAMAAAAALPFLVVIVSRRGGLDHLSEALHQLPNLHREVPSAEVAHLASALRWAGVTAIALAGAALLLLRRNRPFAFALFAIVLTAVELVTLNHGYHPVVAERLAHPPATPSLRLAAQNHADWRVAGVNEALSPNEAELYGLVDARASGVPRVERYAKAWSALGGISVSGLSRTVLDLTRPGSDRLLDAFAVRYVFGADATVRRQSQLTTVFSRPGEHLAERRGALTRAFVAYGWRSAVGLDDALRQLGTSQSRDLHERPVIEGVPAAAVPGPRTPVRADAAHIEVNDPNKASLQVEARRAGYVLLTDTYYPGWTATVDGRDASVRPANVAFRAIPVTAGHHVVTFRYRPAWLTPALSVTLAAAAFSVLALLVPTVLRRRRARGTRSPIQVIRSRSG
jgi:hypothetical protein